MTLLHMSRLSSEKTMSNHGQMAKVLGIEILTGAYEPGSTLPSEAELLARFQISRTVLREVMKTLAAKGLVVSKTRVGTKVLDPVNWNFFDADVLAWKLSVGFDRTFQRNLAEVRRALEPTAAALAAGRRTEADLCELRRCVALMRLPSHTPRTFAHADLEFHLAVGAASGNPMIRSVGAVIETALIAAFSLSSPVSSKALQAKTADAHEAIVKAIEARKPNAAADAMLKVIEAGYDRLRPQLSNEKSNPIKAQTA